MTTQHTTYIIYWFLNHISVLIPQSRLLHQSVWAGTHDVGSCVYTFFPPLSSKQLNVKASIHKYRNCRSQIHNHNTQSWARDIACGTPYFHTCNIHVHCMGHTAHMQLQRNPFTDRYNGDSTEQIYIALPRPQYRTDLLSLITVLRYCIFCKRGSRSEYIRVID